MRSSLILSARFDEFFRDAVVGALRNQNIQAAEEVECYLGQLLAGFARTNPVDCPFEEPLAFRLARALEADHPARTQIFRRLGDVALFVSGFFSDALNASPIDEGYYIAMGEAAYGEVAVACSRFPTGTREGVFQELAEQFAALVDVLAEVSEHHAMTSNQGLLRMYEKWLRTDSKRLARQLHAQGLIPTRGGGTKH